MASAHGFDDENVRHDGQDVVVRGKGRQPVHGEVVDPNDEDGEVDGENPEHEDEEGVRVVVEVVVGSGALMPGKSVHGWWTGRWGNSLFLELVVGLEYTSPTAPGRAPCRRTGRE